MDIDVKFTNSEKSNLTCTGRIFESKSDYIKIFKVVQLLECNDDITYIKYINKFKVVLYHNVKHIHHFNDRKISINTYINPWYNEEMLENTKLENDVYEIMKDNIYYKYEKGYLYVKIIKGEKYKKKVKKKKNKEDFKHSFTLEFPIDNDRIGSCKISTNGSVQLTGCYETEQKVRIFNLLDKMFNKINIDNKLSICNRIKDATLVTDETNVFKHILLDATGDSVFNHTPYISLGEIAHQYPHHYNTIKDKLISTIKDNIIRYESIFPNILNIKYGDTHNIPCKFKISDDSTVEGVKMKIIIDQIKLFNFIDGLNNRDINVRFRNVGNKSLMIYYMSKSGVEITFIIFQSGKINMTNVKNNEHIKEGYTFITEFIKTNINKFIMKDCVFKAVMNIRSKISKNNVNNYKDMDPIIIKIYELLENNKNTNIISKYYDGVIIEFKRKKVIIQHLNNPNYLLNLLNSDRNSTKNTNISMINAYQLEISSENYIRTTSTSIDNIIHQKIQNRLSIDGFDYCVFFNVSIHHFISRNEAIQDKKYIYKGFYHKIYFHNREHSIYYSHIDTIYRRLTVIDKDIEFKKMIITKYGKDTIKDITTHYWYIDEFERIIVEGTSPTDPLAGNYLV